jgi:hypothetical protein
MDRQEIERKIIEIARKVADPLQDSKLHRNAGRLEYLFEQLDKLTTGGGYQ